MDRQFPNIALSSKQRSTLSIFLKKIVTGTAFIVEKADDDTLITVTLQKRVSHINYAKTAS
jgi:hypothetical protein